MKVWTEREKWEKVKRGGERRREWKEQRRGGRKGERIIEKNNKSQGEGGCDDRRR